MTGLYATKLPPRELTLGETIDAATLARLRFRACGCREECPHDGAALDAGDAVKAFLVEKLGLTAQQVRELGDAL